MHQKSVLANGIRVVSETMPSVKSVTLGIWVATGSRFEPENRQGVSHFIEHMLFKGTTSRSARDIAEQVDAVGGQLNAFTGKEYTCYYMKVLDTHLELAMDILSDMMLAARFDEEDIDRERGVILEEIKMYEDTPDELVHDIHVNSVWPGHPLGRNILGTEVSLRSLNKESMTTYHQQFYTPGNIVIAAAGNLTHDLLMQLSTRYFGEFAGQQPLEVVSVPVTANTRTIRHKDTEQVHICLGMPGVPQNSPAIYPMHILNNILGSTVSSHLFQSIREERGLAYSIYSFQTNYSDAGLFTVYAATRPANVVQVIELILQNLSAMKNNILSSAELTKSKEQLKGSLFLGLESSSSHMSRIGKMELTMRKYTQLDEIVAKIEKVTAGDVAEICKRNFSEECMSLTILGPTKDIALPNRLLL